MGTITRTPDGTRYQWAFIYSDWSKFYNRESGLVRHAWYKISKKGEPEQWGTICPATVYDGPPTLINRTSVPKCPACEALLTPEPVTVAASSVVEVTGSVLNHVFLVNLVLSDGTRDERFVVATKDYDPANWDTTKGYPLTRYACTCGAARAEVAEKAPCDHIRAVVLHRAAAITAMFEKEK